MMSAAPVQKKRLHSEPHMGLEGRAFQANIFIEDMVFLGDTRSAEELAVYTNMAPERLCLGCGFRVEEKFTPISLKKRGRLFEASVKLLQFALRAVSASASDKDLTEEEGALFRAIRPLVRNTDCHFLAALTSLVQSILEGRTDCPISGVFGAGKTRAAAARNDWGLARYGPDAQGHGGHQGECSGTCLYQARRVSPAPPLHPRKVGKRAQQAKRTWMSHQPAMMSYVESKSSLAVEGASIRNARSHTVQLPDGWRIWMLPSMMKASSTGIWMSPRPLHEFLAKDLSFGVGITSKHQGDYGRVKKPGHCP